MVKYVKIVGEPSSRLRTPPSEKKVHGYQQSSKVEKIVDNLKNDAMHGPQQTYQNYPAERGSSHRTLDTNQLVLQVCNEDEWLNIEVRDWSGNKPNQELVPEVEVKIQQSKLYSGLHDTANIDDDSRQTFAERSSNNENVPNCLDTTEHVNKSRTLWEEASKVDEEKEDVVCPEDEEIERTRILLNEMYSRAGVADSVSGVSSHGELGFHRNLNMQERWKLLDGNESATRGIPRDNLRWQVGDGCANVFYPQENQPCAKLEYFFLMWFPRLFELLVIYTDFLLMCFLHSSAARTMQGCFLFFPYVVLWGSQYNTSQFEAWYIRSLSKEKVDMPMKAWFNTLPWTGVPTVFLQECYILMYMVYVFPIKFWHNQSRIGPRSFQLSRDHYDKSKIWYLRMLRFVFEDIPTTILLFFVLKWSQDNVIMVGFSLFTSIVSVLWTFTVLVTTSAERDEPITMVIFSSLLIPPNFALLNKR